MTSRPGCDRPLKVALADHSLVMRKLVRQLIAEEPNLVMELEASDGREIVGRFGQCHPDVVLLDTDMPNMNGLETLIELRGQNRRVPILMLSVADALSNELVLEAMACGANDLCKKPDLNGSVDDVLQDMREEITPRIRMWGAAYQQQSARACVNHDLSKRLALRVEQTQDFGKPDWSDLPPFPAVKDSGGPAWRSNRKSFEKTVNGQKSALAIIAASIEKVESLLQVLYDLPAKLQSPIVVMIDGLASHFSDTVIQQISDVSKIPVRHIQSGPIAPNCISVVPGEALAAIQYVDDQPELFLTPVFANSPAPAVLFSSAAIAFGNELLVVMLAGTESHSIASCNMVRQKGGRIILQSQQDSVREIALDSNPLLTTRCLPVDAIADAIAGTAVLHNL